MFINTEYHSTFDGILEYRRMTMFINKLNHNSFSEGYIHRLMNVLGITAKAPNGNGLQM